jgi:hypothetical protein
VGSNRQPQQRAGSAHSDLAVQWDGACCWRIRFSNHQLKRGTVQRSSTYTNTFTHTNRDAHRNTYSYSEPDRFTNSYSDANSYAKSHTEAAPYSASASDAAAKGQ